jgi:hypothetical protein
MSKRGIVYVLGAGASYISPSPEARLPLQKGFFACIAASNFVPQKMALEGFMQQPFKQWLHRKGYGEPYDPNSRLTNDFKINLEEFYSEIERDNEINNDEKARILKILDRIIFESISVPITALRNDPHKSCPNHRALIRLIKPGDTILNFNYDSLADDALLHFCPHWHPVTGHGFKFDDVFGGALPNKAKVFQSQVMLLKPHGSVTFRYKLGDSNETLIRLVGLIKGIQPLHMPMADGWEPFIVAPSTSKSGHDRYMKNILSLAKMKIQRAKKVIVIGYSFPRNDLHIRKIFKGFKGDLIVANPSWDSEDYKARLNDMGFGKYNGFRGFEEFLQNSIG